MDSPKKDEFLDEDDSGYIYEKDENGRTIEASGQLSLNEGIRNANAQKNAGEEYRRDSDEGGHIIGNRFYASGNSENIVAMDMHLNRGGYKSMENHWATELKEGKEVSVEIDVIFQDAVKRPYVFLVKEEVFDGDSVKVEYYSFTNENLEAKEFEIPIEYDEEDDEW